MTEPLSERLPSPIVTGLQCRCPRCGEGPLFRGYLSVVPRCESCGLDLRFADSADGPAVFIIMVVGFIVVGAAAAVEGLFHPPPFVHLLLWIPSTIVLSLLLLRPFKATMVALQYRHTVADGEDDV